jgi:hypothetical protein
MMPMGVHEEKPESATLVKSSANQYFLLNSGDRLQNSSLTNGAQLTTQPWNEFNLQKPAALMNAFASRIAITEVRFPWAIPNITVRNNVFYLRNITTATSFTITIAVGFYTPSELVTAINIALDAVTTNPGDVVCSYDSINQQYSFNQAGAGPPFYRISVVPNLAFPPTASQYFDQPSLLKTMGFALDQVVSVASLGVDGITGLTTNTTYTDYVEICSNRLMMNTDVQDGTSANSGAKTSVVMRIFLADESSLTTVEPIGSRPFIIHRQFVTPKNTKWNPDQFIDWLDISVNDMYGQLVPLPQYLTPGSATPKDGAYPDFQITCLAAEM